MKRRQVIIELPALQDIAEAFSWLAQHEATAEKWFDSIYDTMASLEYFPERCSMAPESESFKFEIREIFHGRRQHKYRILFTVSADEVHVLHVRHGARQALGESESESD